MNPGQWFLLLTFLGFPLKELELFMSNPPPSSPTSEPIPASDQLREALDRLVVKARSEAFAQGHYGDYASASNERSMIEARDELAAARAAVEELFGAQQAEIERLRKLTEKEGWTEELWSDVAVLCQRGAFIAGAKWREIVSGISGDGIIRAEAESRYSISPESPATELASLRVERDELAKAAETWRIACDQNAEGLASLRSSSLTAEEAEHGLSIHQGCVQCPPARYCERCQALDAKLKLSALRSSTADKGNTK